MAVPTTRRAALGALLLLSSAVVGGSVFWSRTTNEPASLVATRVAEVASFARAPQPEDRSVEPDQRVGALPVVAAAGEPAAERWVVRGRCVDAAGEQPLAGCLVEVCLGPRGPSNFWRPWPEQVPAATVTTGDDGRFAVTLDGGWRRGGTVRVSAPGRVGRAGHWPSPTSQLDLGDVPLRRGHHVTGRVVDEQGVGIDRASVLLVAIEEPVGDLPADRILRAETDVRGHFAMPKLLPGGEYHLAVHGTGPLLEPRRVTVEPDTDESSFTARVQRPDEAESICGQVVDELDVPVPGIFLTAIGEGSSGRVESGEDGRFAIPRADPSYHDGTAGVRLTAAHAQSLMDQKLPTSRERVRWGQRDVKVVMHRLAQVELLVTDAHGVALQAFDAAAWRPTVGHATATTRNLAFDGFGPHRGGRVTLPQLHDGTCHVLVVPHDPALASRLHSFVVGPGLSRQVVALPPRAPLQVEIVDGSGAPIAGVDVELVRLLRHERLAETAEANPIERVVTGRADPGVCLVGAVQSGVDGVATIGVPSESLWLRARGEGLVTRVQQVAVDPRGTSLRVLMQAAAALRVSLTPGDGRETLGVIPPQQGDELLLVLRRDGETAASRPVVNGVAELRSLPAGDYTVGLRYCLANHPAFPSSITTPVGEVTLRAGERCELAVDTTPFAPGHVEGRIVVDGAPFGGNDLFLYRQGSPFAGSLRLHSDVDGRVSAPVPPGEYSVSLALPVESGPGWTLLPLAEPLHVAAGQRSELRRDVARRRGRFRLLAADGSPIARRAVRVRLSGYHRPGPLATDDDGWVELWPMPDPPFELECRDADGQTTSFEVLGASAGGATGSELRAR